ncbi:hypothetical protein SERLA73DRAFT_174837 [Serpula lacrymans var. lacrymans S7.3]|uniref:Proteasome assembly chaperone 3 n=2 Tax=Serpula lacrymans var. lacrymans TaxID=341189 RepID=F8PIJ7_SERL3|nr:uncharacterized protein SERLADRAFT_456511 [Serpula lacrymans var. lacrymans S7.9]EGO03368.1 hypothetical protein SERLA73DRAFT_174837 [Serpula lacrymans var. lacrymans S7.3]EGO29139.1 hypothetical protein SERLADRAFT_456511 [Serpula lacrymans var. lacrymans S7.9]
MLNVLQTAKELNGLRTEIVLQEFADRILLLISQKGKVGNLIQTSIPSTTPLIPAPPPDASNPNPLPPPPPAVQLTPLLGSGPSEHMQALHSIYAAQAATIIWNFEDQLPLKFYRRNVIVGLALQSSGGDTLSGLSDGEREEFHAVMNMLQTLLSSAKLD